MAQLRYLDETGHIRYVELGLARFTIGRVNSCNITIIDDMVSREHAAIEPTDDGRHRIRDLGSRNKTSVNGQLVSDTILSAGDVIRIGDRVLEFVDDGVAAAAGEMDFLTPDESDPADCEWLKTRAPVTLALEQLGRLTGLFGDFGLMSRPEEIVDAALSFLISDLQAERGFVALKGDDRKELRLVAQRGLARIVGQGRTPVSQSFVYAALLQHVSGRYPRAGATADESAGYARAAMVAPLVYRNETLGVVYVDRPGGKRTFSAPMLQHFIAAAAQMGALVATSARRLAEEGTAFGRAYLASVQRLQAQFAPHLPELDGFGVAFRLLAGSGRCGDVCDVLALPEGGAVALVVDAGGHGTVGIAQAAAIRTALRTALSLPGAAGELAAVFDQLNASLAALPGRQTVSCCAVHADVSSGRLSYINAGAQLPLLLPAPKRVQSLDHVSLVPGADGDYAYEATSVDLPATFRLVLTTDGLLDAASPVGERFGEERLRRVLLEQEAFAEPEHMAGLVAKAVEDHLAGAPHEDDALVLVVSR